ncbi:MAG: methionyl-tRNA formyltransferase [Firmicutes bacterium]|nr:methionyl-tRNA formyltransferase [Bacillota bacterium]
MKVVFMGTPEFAVPSLDMLVREGYGVVAVVTQPDKPKGRGKKLCCPPVKEYAEKLGIHVLQPEKVNTEEFVSTLKKIAPDLLITAAYGKILPQEVLDIPKKGCINVHASLLPKYRGAAPINWAIINGETKTGITTMLTDAGMDTGDILLKREIDIPEDMTAGELHDKLAFLGAEVLKDTLEMIKTGTIQRIPQREEEASYAPMLKKEMGLIDWDKPSENIHNLIRGTNPWPGAYTFYKGKRVKIWKSKVACPASCTVEKREDYIKMPGLICKKEKNGIFVACGKGYIQILELQFDGCKKLCIEECWHNFNVGEVFG